MRKVDLRFIGVSFSYESSSDIITYLDLHFPGGWTGIVGANGVGKTTVAKLAAGLLVPSSGIVRCSGSHSSVFCEQETRRIPDRAEDFTGSDDPAAGVLRSILSVSRDFPDRWDTLSHGERKRLQIGTALWLDPDVLVLDEPTNHLDTDARRKLHDALASYRGVGIIVSHDRELLDSICSHCLFMREERAVMRAGTFSEGEAAEAADDASRERAYRIARDDFRKAERSARLLRRRETIKEKSLSKKNISKHDHDAKRKIDIARLTGKDGTGSRKIKLMEDRARLLGDNARSKYFERRDVDGILFRGRCLRRDAVISVPAGSVSAGDLTVVHPDLLIRPDSRIALTGNNGAGKSVLVKKIVESLSLPSEEFICVPQEIDDALWLGIRGELFSLEGSLLGNVLTAVHRLGSEPERVLASADSPSPGEKRKIMLGLGLLKNPGFIIMDEPTNHMDLPSVVCLENALCLFEGAVLVVSHDRRFLEKVTSSEWRVHRTGGTSSLNIFTR
jgi:ATPase subunit of ABC transporter with duplicated ATPase domains